jgi:hypothetical protein
MDQLLGTGFIYNWGLGFSGENVTPNQITGVYASGADVGQDFNAAIVFTPGPPEPLSPKIRPRNEFGNFGVQIFNTDARVAPLKEVSIETTFSGSGVNSSFVQGNAFVGKAVIALTRGDNAVKSDKSFVNLGSTLGVSSGKYIFPQDTFVKIYSNDLQFKTGDSWLEYENQFLFYNNASFKGYTFTGFKPADAGIILSLLPTRSRGLNLKIYDIDYGTAEAFPSGSLLRQRFIFNNLGQQNPIIEQKLPQDNKSWASYNIQNGMQNNTKNVFAYAFQFIDIVTTRESGIIIKSNESEKNPFEIYRNLLHPVLNTGFDTSFSKYIGYCFNRLSCPPTEPEEDAIECYTGIATTGKEYADFISGIKEKYRNQAFVQEFDTASNLSISSGISISGLFVEQTGSLVYNSFFTGESIKFELYPYNYTGLYRSYHLGNDPLFPSYSFEITYPNDFTDINSLTNALNTRLRNVNWPVWYPYECLSGEFSGVYLTGNLMSFQVFSGIETGEKDFNNIIHFRSLRNLVNGFDITLNKIDREQFIEDLRLQQFRRGFSYLIPNVIELQGLTGPVGGNTGNRWLVLDRRSGLYDDLTGLESTKVPLDANPDFFGFDINNLFLNSSTLTGLSTGISFDIEEIFISGGFKTLNIFSQKGFNPVPAYCNTPLWSREITIVQPTGWPSGVNGCDPKLEFPKEEPDDEEEEDGEEEDENIELFLEVKRTGWLLEPTGQYLNCLTAPDYNPAKIQFSNYRLVLKDFSGLKPTPENIYLIPQNEIYINNINLWSLQSEPIGVHTGEAQCLIGSDYTVDIQDIIGLPFDFDFQYSITGEDRSGIYRSMNEIIDFPLKSFYPTALAFTRTTALNAPTPTGFYAIGGVNNVRTLDSGSMFWLFVTGSNWTGGRSVRWESSYNSVDFSGFRLFRNGSGYLSGVGTGNNGIGPGIYTGYLPRQDRFLRLVQPSIGDQNISITYTGWNGFYDFPTVKFVNRSGKVVGNTTGLLTADFTGSGIITNTFGNRFFYDPPTQEVYFRIDLSGFVTGSGILSGDAIAIKDYVINQELYAGGSRLSLDPIYVERISGGNFIGTIKNVNYFEPNVVGLYNLTGLITGISNSGYFNYNQVVTGSGIPDGDNVPFYPIFTGFKQAEALLFIIQENLSNFEFLRLNNRTITYNDNTGSYQAPDYFHNIDSLLNIINTNEIAFNATGIKLNDTTLFLRASEEFAIGFSGNNLTITGLGPGIIAPKTNFESGITFYPPLLPITPFSGVARGNVASTGFFTGLGSGIITGDIRTFTGVRKFTGVWDIKTGSDILLSFLGNNFISGEIYKNKEIFEELYNNFQIQVFYDNELNTDNSDPVDISEIKIKDNNFNLLENPPTGENGEFIFRITGVRTV